MIPALWISEHKLKIDLILLLYCLPFLFFFYRMFVVSDHSTGVWCAYMNCTLLGFFNILYNQSYLVENSKECVLVHLVLSRSSYKSCHYANVHTSWSPLVSLLDVLSVHIQILPIQLALLQYFLSSLLEYLNGRCSFNSISTPNCSPHFLSPILCVFTVHL